MGSEAGGRRKAGERVVSFIPLELQALTAGFVRQLPRLSSCTNIFSFHLGNGSVMGILAAFYRWETTPHLAHGHTVG